MPRDADPSRLWSPPNLTPDAKTGMSARMDEADLRAIHKYLRTLPPVEHDTGPRVRPRGK